MIRVVLPAHLRLLAKVNDDILLHVESPVTQLSLLNELEAKFPALKGTIREHVTLKRRPFVRFFACEEDLSQHPPDDLLPAAVIAGTEPFLIVGAIAGGLN